MRTRSPYGNLTAVLAVVASLELVVNRLLGHLFTTPSCHSMLGCLALRIGPFLLYLTGILALVVVAGGVAGHLLRGELFPRGMRFTIGVLTLVFVLLVALSLLLGRVPPRYETHLKTSFGFVVGMVALAFAVAAPASGRARAGVILFALPPLLHVMAFIAAHAVWWRDGWLQPDQLILTGELFLILGAATSSLLLLPRGWGWGRIAPGLALGAGVATFFFVASLGRPDLIQAMGLYAAHLDLPRGTSLLGFAYTGALFGFTVTLVDLLLSPGATRLAGTGLALVALGGYQTASPVELSLTLGGMIMLATGLSRLVSERRSSPASNSSESWKARLASVGGKIADTDGTVAEAPVVEIAAGAVPGNDRTTIRAKRRGRPIELVARRERHALENLTVVVGAPPDATPDATIESHETWLARRPEDRPSATRIKTDDPTFDRKWGVYGRAPLADRSLRRRLLATGDGTIKLWSGVAAEFVVSARPTNGDGSEPSGRRDLLRLVLETVDLLGDLVEASEPSSPPVSSLPS